MNKDRRPAYNIPNCTEPKVLVNKRAIYLLQQGGIPSTPMLRPVRPLTSGDYAQYTAIAATALGDSKDYMRLASFYIVKDEAFEYMYTVARCRHCDLCRQSRRMDISARCALESELYPTPPYFILLTYAPENMPHLRKRSRPGELCVSDVQDFFKRLRSHWDRQGLSHHVRYMVAGEYGSKRGRPHYHILLWNNPYGADEFHPAAQQKLADDIYKCWSWCTNRKDAFGCEPAGDFAARYASKYVAKQDTYRMQHKPAGFRRPFILMSTGNGGLGSGYIRQRADYLRANPTVSRLEYTSRHDGMLHHVPISSYLHQQIWPSHSRVVPNVIRQAYKEIVGYYETMVYRGLVSPDAAKAAVNYYAPPGMLRTYDFCKGPVPPCWLSTRMMAAKLQPVVDYLANLLEAYRQHPMDYDAASYYAKMQASVQRQDNSASMAGLSLVASRRYADMLARETV